MNTEYSMSQRYGPHQDASDAPPRGSIHIIFERPNPHGPQKSCAGSINPYPEGRATRSSIHPTQPKLDPPISPRPVGPAPAPTLDCPAPAAIRTVSKDSKIFIYSFPNISRKFCSSCPYLFMVVPALPPPRSAAARWADRVSVGSAFRMRFYTSRRGPFARRARPAGTVPIAPGIGRRRRLHGSGRR